jgi:adenylylsulfate kinase-like enzyme
VDAPYEAPERPEVHILTADRAPEDCAQAVVNHIAQRGIIQSN